jgi:DNA segregation ATPase FtsK/SpoIIIE, S-DNA-T family
MLFTWGDSGERDVALSAHPDTSVRDALDAAGRAIAGNAAALPLYNDRVPLSLGEKLGASDIRDGAQLRFSLPIRTGQDLPTGALCVFVIAGPHTGEVARLVDGATIGRAADISLPNDSALSAQHCRLIVDSAGAVTVEDLDSTNGTFINGSPLTAPDSLTSGDYLEIGSSIVAVGHVPPADAATTLDEAAGTVLYNRPPRLIAPSHSERVNLPTPPTQRSGREWPIAMIVVPLGLGIALAWALKRPEYLLFTLLGPLMLITNVVSERRKGRRSTRSERRIYAEARAAAETALQDALRKEAHARRREAPDAAAIGLAASGPTSALWCRHRRDSDFLTVRLGVGTLPASTEVREERAGVLPPRPLSALPVVVSLPDVAVLGVAGPGKQVRAIARWVLTQCAALHSPRDLSIVLITRPSGRQDWGWSRWLPHVRGDDGGPWCRIGNDHLTTETRVGELLALLERRVEMVRSRGNNLVERLPAILVVIDGSRDVRQLGGVSRLLQEGADVGIYLICIDDQENWLPRDCGAVAVVQDLPDGGTNLVLRRSGHAEQRAEFLEEASTEWAERVARALAPLRDAEPSDVETQLPTQVRLAEMLDLPVSNGADVVATWRRRGRSTRVPLGASSDGAYHLDLIAGPHGLIAGTTGAGKSGLLQTLVISLAIQNPPEALNVLLVDYKGGAAFRDCQRLPHCVGMVTDLDASATARALVSLRAEITNRERQLADAKVSDIEQYWAKRDSDPSIGLAPMPRLVLCIDEFRELVREFPEFIDGLVDVAARGRSLGFHLVLATQNPAGVVTQGIRSNTEIRISLRVADEASSSDIIGTPDAGRLPKLPGRAFVKIGSGNPTAIQTARVDGAPPGASARIPEPTAHRLTWTELGEPMPVDPEPPAEPGQRTDLAVLVDAVREAACLTDSPLQRSPWLPPLPNIVPLTQLVEDDPWRIPFALRDLPSERQQPTLSLDMHNGTHLLVAGAPRSGRSTTLRTIAASAASRLGPEQIALYGIDCGGGALRALEILPHCGAVVTNLEPDRIDRLQRRLLTEINDRQRQLNRHGANDLAELIDLSPVDAPPYLLLMLDSYDGYAATFDDVDNGRLGNELSAILRDGPRVGVRAVITGGRGAMLSKISSLIPDRLVLRLAALNDYGAANIPARDIPAEPLAGRGLYLREGITSVQVATIGADPAGRAQSDAITRLSVKPAVRSSKVFRVDALPDEITYAQALSLPAATAGPLVGVGGDELTRFGVDVGPEGGTFIVLGARQTGRSTALSVIAADLSAAGHPLVLVTPRPSLLDSVPLETVRHHVRGSACAEASLDEEVFRGAVTLVDDLEVLQEATFGTTLTTLIRSGGAVVVAGLADGLRDAFRGPALEAGKSGNGLLLCPTVPAPGAIFGGASRLSRNMLGATHPGRGALLRAGVSISVQVPLLPVDEVG